MRASSRRSHLVWQLAIVAWILAAFTSEFAVPGTPTARSVPIGLAATLFGVLWVASAGLVAFRDAHVTVFGRQWLVVVGSLGTACLLGTEWSLRGTSVPLAAALAAVVAVLGAVGIGGWLASERPAGTRPRSDATHRFTAMVIAAVLLGVIAGALAVSFRF